MKKHREKGIKTFFDPLISSYPDDKVPYPLVSYGENKKEKENIRVPTNPKRLLCKNQESVYIGQSVTGRF